MRDQVLVKQVMDSMDQTGVPGVGIGVWRQDAEFPIEEMTGIGYTNHDHAGPVLEDTLFQIGSISKTMTATIAMRLVEMGKLDLDTPIRHYLPDFRMQDQVAQEKATVRHLFIHTAGWVGDYFENTGRGDDALARYVANMAALPQQAPLGALWSYNNASFSLAGRVIEVATRQPFEQVMYELLFAPLGMTMSFFFTEEMMTHSIAVGHIVTPEGVKVVTPWALARSAHPAGGVTSTVRDMLRYARFHLNNGRTDSGEQLMQPATIAAMQAPQTTAGSMADAVGISWLLNDLNGVRLVSHGGATNGQIAQLMLVPDKGFALVVLTNANRGREVTRDLTNWALYRYLGLAQPTLQYQTLTKAELQPYTGYYKAQLSEVDVTSMEGSLVLQIIPQPGFPDKNSPAAPTPPPAPAAFFAEDRVIITDGPSKESKCEFIRNDQGEIAWFRVGGRIHRRQ